MRKVAVIVGSLRRESINKKLAGALAKLADGKLEFHMIRIDDLPLYNADDDADPSASVRRFKGEVEACDAVLFVTPEHNRSIPSALKNAFDWGTRPRGEDSWRGRPAAVLGTSPGNLGTGIAQQHMRTIASGHSSAVMGTPLVFLKYMDGLIDDDGTITNEGTRTFLLGFVDQFAAFIDNMTGA